jgi:hypothetical protein
MEDSAHEQLEKTSFAAHWKQVMHQTSQTGILISDLGQQRFDLLQMLGSSYWLARERGCDLVNAPQKLI